MATVSYRGIGAVQRPAVPPGGSTSSSDIGAVERQEVVPPVPTVGYIRDVISNTGLRPAIFSPGLGR